MIVVLFHGYGLVGAVGFISWLRTNGDSGIYFLVTD